MRSLGPAVFFGAAFLMFSGSAAWAEDPKPLQPAQPVATSNLQIYIKVKDQALVEYCQAEHLGVPRCVAGTMFEANDTCAPPYKVASVSCALSDLGSEPRLVENGVDAKQMTGTCVWTFAKLAADKAPTAKTTLLCVK